MTTVVEQPAQSDLEPVQETLPIPFPPHYRWVGPTRMVCINDECDLTKHVFCSCEH